MYDQGIIYNNLKGTLYRPIEMSSMPDRHVSARLPISLPKEWKGVRNQHFYALV
jgi:hypothetical protein